MTDLSTLNTAQKSEQGVWINPHHPETLEPITDWHIKIAGQDSKRYRSRESAVRAEQRNHRARNPLASADDVDKDRERAVHLVVSCVIQSKGVKLDGEEIDLSDIETGVRILSDPGFRFLLDELDREIHRRGNFLPGSASNSSNGPKASSGSPSGDPGVSGGEPAPGTSEA